MDIQTRGFFPPALVFPYGWLTADLHCCPETVTTFIISFPVYKIQSLFIKAAGVPQFCSVLSWLYTALVIFHAEALLLVMGLL